MNDLLLSLYLLNSTLLINHEIDSAYRKEWELFRLPGGVTGFLLIHFPILLFILYGLALVVRQAFAGLIFSLVLSAGGLFAFGIHTYFIRKGDRGFASRISLSILIATLIVSLIQMALTLVILLG